MAKTEEVVDALRVYVEPMVGQVPQTVDLGSKAKPAVLLGHEQRLDADRVAGEDEALIELVPDRDRIHALEPYPSVVAPAQIGGEDRLRIAVIGLEGVAALQLAPELGMVEDLAVEDDRMPTVGAQDRLVAAFDIDDAEPAHAEAEVTVSQIAGVVGPAVAQPVAGSNERALAATALPPRLYHPAIPHIGFS